MSTQVRFNNRIYCRINFRLEISSIDSRADNDQLPRWRVVYVKTMARKIDFVGNGIPESTIFFFVFEVNFIFTPIFVIKINEKNS